MTSTDPTAAGARDLDVLCLGEVLVDMLPDRRGPDGEVDRYEVHQGGAPANVATGLARLGLAVGFRGVVGDDPFGRFLATRLAGEGVRCLLRLAPDAPTALFFVALDARGERSFFSPNAHIAAEQLLAPADVDGALLARARWLHCGTVAHVRPEAQAALRDAVARAKRVGTAVSFDPNVRANLWPDPEALRRLCRDVVPGCTLVKLSEDEAELVTGESDPSRAAARLVAQGVALAVVTLGARGALVRRGGDELVVPGERVQVVDTTGAGDGFVAGLLSRIARAGPVADLPAPALVDAVRFANRVAARVVACPGAVAGLPRLADFSV